MKRLLKQIDLFLLDLMLNPVTYWTLLLLPLGLVVLNRYMDNPMLSSSSSFILALYWTARGRLRQTKKRWTSYVYWTCLAIYAPYFIFEMLPGNFEVYKVIATAAVIVMWAVDYLTDEDDGGNRRRKLQRELEENSVRTRTREWLA